MFRFCCAGLVLASFAGCASKQKDGTDCDSSTAAGCASGDADTDSDADTDTDTDTAAGASFSASWDSTGVTITVENGSGVYTLGMAETDPENHDPWTGEDCLKGYFDSHDNLTLLYCHPLTSTGASFTSGGDPAMLDENTETVFVQNQDLVITYAVWDEAHTSCWTFGADTTYYTYSDSTCVAASGD